MFGYGQLGIRVKKNKTKLKKMLIQQICKSLSMTETDFKCTFRFLLVIDQKKQHVKN